MSAEVLRASDLQGEADAYEFLEQLRWGTDGPQRCPHCGSDKGAWFLRSKDPEGRKSKGGTSARSQRRVWKCRESQCRRQFSVLTNTVMHGTKMPVQCWVEVIYALCDEDAGLSARDVAERWGVAEKSAQLMLERIQHALERPEVAGASLASNAPLWVRVQTPRIDTAAQRAAAAKGQRKRAANANAAAQVKVDVERALSEALAKPDEAAADTDSAPAPASPRYGWIEDPPKTPRKQRPPKKTTPVSAPKPAPIPPAEPDPAPAARPRIDQKQVESDVQRLLAELTESEGLFVEGWLDEDAGATQSTEPTKSTESTEPTEPTEPTESTDDSLNSLGPAWFDVDESAAAPTTGQLDLFDNKEEE